MGNRSFISYFLIWLKGFCMGAADVVPGVSGGTMAFILGIYEELIGAIRSFDIVFVKRLFSLRIKKALDHVPWPFLLALGIGIFTAIFSLARILSWLLENRPVFIWSFFFGLVLASIFTVGRHLNKWNLPLIGWLLLGAVGAYLLVGMVPVSTPETPWFLVLSGAVAICAMILPGISGSFILVLMGKYDYLLRAVNNRDFLTLALAATGAAIGLISFVRLLSWLLEETQGCDHRRLDRPHVRGLEKGVALERDPPKHHPTGQPCEDHSRGECPPPELGHGGECGAGSCHPRLSCRLFPEPLGGKEGSP